MPDYLERISTLEELENFISEDRGINKVVIVSGKKNATAEFKAASSDFRG